MNSSNNVEESSFESQPHSTAEIGVYLETDNQVNHQENKEIDTEANISKTHLERPVNDSVEKSKVKISLANEN